jgi:hypothetical protein
MIQGSTDSTVAARVSRAGGGERIGYADLRTFPRGGEGTVELIE